MMSADKRTLPQVLQQDGAQLYADLHDEVAGLLLAVRTSQALEESEIDALESAYHFYLSRSQAAWNRFTNDMTDVASLEESHRLMGELYNLMMAMQREDVGEEAQSRQHFDLETGRIFQMPEESPTDLKEELGICRGIQLGSTKIQ